MIQKDLFREEYGDVAAAVLASTLPGTYTFGNHICLRDYQDRARLNSFAAWDRGVSGVLVRQPTGTGKTVTAAAIADQWYKRDPANNRVIILFHEVDLLEQFAGEMEDLLGVEVGVEQSKEKVGRKNQPWLIVASRETLRVKVTHEFPEPVLPCTTRVTSRLFKFDNTKNWLVVCDEAHRYAFKLRSCRQIFQWFGANPKSRRLMLSATPERSDKVSLAKLAPETALDYPMCCLDKDNWRPNATDDGWVVPYVQTYIKVEGVDFKGLKNASTGDLDEDAIGEALIGIEEIERKKKLEALCRPMISCVGEKKTMVFCPNRDTVHGVSSWLNVEYRRDCSRWMDGTMSNLERTIIKRQHARGDFQFLVVCDLCKEGHNDPTIEAVALFRPTKFRGLKEQMMGRGCRPLKGTVTPFMTPEQRRAAIAASAKPTCLIVDLVGITGLADCPSTASIFANGLPDGVQEILQKKAEKNAAEGKESNPIDDVREAKEEFDRNELEKRLKREAERAKQIEIETHWKAVDVVAGHGAYVEVTGKVMRMPCGKEHKGKTLPQVPVGYLEWFSKQSWAPARYGKHFMAAVQAEIRRRNVTPGQRAKASKASQSSVDEVNRLLSEAWRNG